MDKSAHHGQQPCELSHGETAVLVATSPLANAAERFALDRPIAPAPPPSSTSTPFGQRFAVETPHAHRPDPSQWQWCARRQMPVTADGTPIYHSTGMVMSTTGPSSDGGPSTGGEEWRQDYQADTDAAAQ